MSSGEYISTQVNYWRQSTNYVALDNGEQFAAKGGSIIPIPDTIVQSARGFPFTLTENGFELAYQSTSLSYQDFLNMENQNKNLKERYYNEMEDFLKQKLNASRVVAFHHAIRSSDPSKKQKEPASLAHCDYTVRTSRHLFDGIATAHERRGRFMVINIWRNIHDDNVITNHHLAMCDPRTVCAPDDFLSFVGRGDDGRENETYRLDGSNQRRYKWYYFPFMQKNETLLFMQYDSNFNSLCRNTFHSSVPDPTCFDPNNENPRESIELRLIAFFPDFEVNTIPELVFSDDDLVETVVSNLMVSLRYPDKWGVVGRNWMKQMLYLPGGVSIILNTLIDKQIQERKGRVEVTSNQKQIIKNKLMENGTFEKVARQYF